jgi:diadenylate cyclase
MFAIRWQIAVDFLVLSLAFYALLRLARSTRALRIGLAVVALHTLALLAKRLDLVVTSWVLDGSAILTVVLLLLIFQPELRRAFMRLDAAFQRWPRPPAVVSQRNRMVADAAFDLARDRVGALMVIVRRDSIDELTEDGLALRSAISPELLIAIFQKTSPLHDGAVVIDGAQIAKAGVVLPLTQRQDVQAWYGTRHRAGMGLAERCDASIVVVSEERGDVTLMRGPRIQHMESADKLLRSLEQVEEKAGEKTPAHFGRFMLKDLRLKLASLALAGLIWSMSFLASGTTIRTVTVPVEFSNVPSGMEVSDQSVDALELQVRGSPWIMDSISLNKLMAEFDLRGLRPGRHTLQLALNTLDLPPGIAVDRVTPAKIRVDLAEARPPAPPR